MDEKKIEDLIYKTLTRFYQVVIAPKMATKDDVGKVEVRMEHLETRMGHLETRMDGLETEVSGLKKAVWNVSDHQGKILDIHEKRITALEEA